MAPWRIGSVGAVAVVPSRSLPPPPMSPPHPCFTKRLLLRLLGGQDECARYTIAKFRDFDTYARTTTRARQVAVIVLTPAPSLVASLLPTLIPLQDPALGILHYTGFLAQFTLTMALVMFGCVHQVRAPNAISREDISNAHAVWIAVTGASLLTGIVTAMAYAWRFPVPFIWVTVLGPFVATFMLSHVIVLGSKLWQSDSRLRRPLAQFLPPFAIQASQIMVYSIFSAIFQDTSAWGQIALSLVFPAVKFCYRSVVRRLLRHLREDANEVAVSGIEICAAIYQSMIMQNSPSPFATAVIMGLDATQNLFHIYVLTAKQSTIPQVELAPTAQRLLFGEEGVQASLRMVRELTHVHVQSVASVHPARPPTEEEVQVKAGSNVKRFCSGELAGDTPTKQIVTHALEIMQSAESILIVEYFEVAVPISNALYVLWASHFDSAVYNPKLRPYYYNPRLLGPAMVSLAMYTGFQVMSLVVVYVLLRRRFGISAQPLLAFVLERHAWSLQGKLIAWLVILSQFPVAHYGVNFKFKLNFARANIGPVT